MVNETGQPTVGQSRPRGRLGLKLEVGDDRVGQRMSRPPGVWIETSSSRPPAPAAGLSPPRVRGLKQRKRAAGRTADVFAALRTPIPPAAGDGGESGAFRGYFGGAGGMDRVRFIIMLLLLNIET